MRMMLRLHIDATRGTAALKSGALQKAIGAFSQKFKPESTYFGLESGQRTGFFIFDMKNFAPVSRDRRGVLRRRL